MAAERCRGGRRFSTLRPWWALGLYRLRLVFRERLELGMGSVSLRAVVPRSGLWLGLGSRLGLGACLGDLALRRRIRWLGADAAGRSCDRRRDLPSVLVFCGDSLFGRARCVSLRDAAA